MLRLQRKMARTPSENVCGPKSFPSNDFQTQTDSGQSATCINPPASPAHAGLAPLIFRPRRSDPVASLSHFSGPQQQQQKRRLFLRPSEPSVVRWETKRRSQNVSGNEQIYFYIIQGILRKAREPACTHVSSPCSKLRNIFTVHRKATPCHSSGEFTVDKSRQHVRLKREVSDTLPIRAARAEAPPVGIPARKAPIMGLRPEQKARLAIEERLQQSIILVGKEKQIAVCRRRLATRLRRDHAEVRTRTKKAPGRRETIQLPTIVPMLSADENSEGENGVAPAD